MEGIGVQILGFIFSLSLLVLLHELGHFIPAKLFKTKVEKFYLFFNPKFSLFKFKKGETEYGIGWLPLGGYVKIAGMIDESMDKKQMAKDPEPWEFRSKPAWQRLIIMLGGVTVNAFLAWFIYSMIFFGYGDKYIANKDLTDGIWVSEQHPFIQRIGLKTGDKIVSMGGEEVQDLRDILNEIILVEEMVIERDGEEMTIEMPVDLLKHTKSDSIPLNLSHRMPFEVSEVAKGSEADKIGLQEKDVIVSLNNEDIKYYDQFETIKYAHQGDSLPIQFKRGDELISQTVFINDSMTVGFRAAMYGYDALEEKGLFVISNKKYTLGEAFSAGYDKTVKTLDRYYRGIKKMFVPESGAAASLGGFKTIGSIFPKTWDWQIIWERTAFLSIILAFMNLLPIPALDGGHVMFLLYEIIARRKPGEKFMERAQMVGMIILISLMVFANLNDTVFELFR